MAKDPLGRYQTPQEAADALAPFVAPAHQDVPSGRADAKRDTLLSAVATAGVRAGGTTVAVVGSPSTAPAARDTLVESARGTLHEMAGPPPARAGRRGWLWLGVCAAVLLVAIAVIAAVEVLRRNAFNAFVPP
jgi:hypothetical protein